MKVKDLPKFVINIGNTLEDEYDVVATNNGISVNDKIVGGYDEERNINDTDDFLELIDDAIRDCDVLTDEDKEELGVVLYSDVLTYDINSWWDEEEISD